MNHADLLGRHLKSDFLCDLFETYDVDVVYNYDRLHEGTPDEYRAELPALGLELAFDEDQVLRTVFATPTGVSDTGPFPQLSEGLPLFESTTGAKAFAATKSIPATYGSADFFGETRDWVRLEYPGHSVHYEFRDGELALVTLTLALD